MDYFGLVKKSFKIVWKHKFLWILGLLAGGTGYNNFNLYSFNLGDWNSRIKSEDLPNKIHTSLSSGIVKGQTVSTDLTAINQWASTHWWLILVIIAAVFILGIVLMIISYCCQGGLIEAVDEIEKGNKSSFGRAFVAGWHHFWSLLGSGLLVFLILLTIFSYLTVSGIILFFFGSKIFTVFWMVGLVPSLIVLVIYTQVLIALAYRIIMIEKLGAVESLKKANSLIFSKFKEVILSWLVLIALGIVVGLAMALLIAIITSVLVAIGIVVYLGAKLIPTLIYSGIFGLAFFILLLALGGFIQAVFSSFWTLVYRELK